MSEFVRYGSERLDEDNSSPPPEWSVLMISGCLANHWLGPYHPNKPSPGIEEVSEL